MLDKTEFLHQVIDGESVLVRILELRKGFPPNGARKSKMFYVIDMFFTEDGDGPADLSEAAELRFLVWDQFLDEYHSTTVLSEAIEVAELLNQVYREGTYDDEEGNQS
jgi:hypothetical protein